MPILYDVILGVSLLLASPYLLLKTILGGHGLKERLGLWSLHVPSGAGPAPPLLWLHAASVGEVHSLAAFVPILRRTYPDHRFILSVTTRAGRERASELGDDIYQVFYLPVDLACSVLRVIKKVKPQALILTETELWPNLILHAHRQGVKIALVNGRLSDRSFSRYLHFKRTMARVLGAIDLFCVQTQEDADRFQALGAAQQKVRVAGNFKGDLLMVSAMRGQREPVRDSLGIPSPTRLLVAGSTRPGEEEMLLDTLVDLRKSDYPFRAIVAPRHVQRVPKVIRLLQSTGLNVRLFSQMEQDAEASWEVLVVDTLGQLMRLYSAADVAFVGGSLMPYGGHNPLEPASYGVPVLFGPHMEHCRQSAHSLMQSGGGVRVKDGTELKSALSHLLEVDQERRQRGSAALRTVQQSVGASERTARILRESVL
jgi:3-deoxy-D-manno-octulosonic-acid transferase